MRLEHLAPFAILNGLIFAACASEHPIARPNHSLAATVSPAQSASPTPPIVVASPVISANAAPTVQVPPPPPPPPPVPPPQHIVDVVAWDLRGCAIFDNGMLQCWGGLNMYGELGVGHRNQPNHPEWVKNLHGVKKVALSNHQTCATCTAGELYCWGRNNFLENDSREEILTPVVVPDVSNVVDVSVSPLHGCAVDAHGDVHCWGKNANGQLGLGISELDKTFKKPTKVPGIANAIGVVATDMDTHVWTKKGELYRFGWAADTKRDYADPTPHHLTILQNVERVKIDNQQACALLAGGTIRCYSHETYKDFLAGKEHDFGPELAALVSAFTRRKIPSKTKNFVFPDGRGLSGVVDFVVFNHDASAVTDKGEVYSWGSAERGTVGRPDRTKGFFPPTRIGGFTHATKIAGSFLHRCALEETGEVRCFGQHLFLGNDSGKDSTTAVIVQGIPKIVHLAANDQCTFALGADHSLWVWGHSFASACGMEEEEMTSYAPRLVPLDKSIPQIP